MGKLSTTSHARPGWSLRHRISLRRVPTVMQRLIGIGENDLNKALPVCEQINAAKLV